MSKMNFMLAWVVVSDIKKAEKFFVEKLGLNLQTKDENYGWLELQGEDGAHLGVAQKSSHSEIAAGSNAIVTFTVSDIEKTKADFIKKGVKLVGETMEVPGHVKLQFFVDDDGNQYQIVETLN